MTCPDADTLAALASLSVDERAAIADHAASCEACRTVMRDLLDIAQAATLAPTAPASSRSLPPATPSTRSIPATPATPSTIDRYRIDRPLGAGAMGVVFAAYDPELARPVAIKLLRSGGSADRLRREAQALARLTHPNVVAVHDVGEHAGATFLTMALVDGENLRAWLRSERTTAQIVDAIVQAARGVAAAHEVGIVHRDLKPDNIFVARDGTVLVGDFGLARAGEPGSGERLPAAGDLELTQTGAVVGTPVYMAPEQLEGEASAASDQFALCVTAWEALHGKRPFAGATLADLEAAIRRGPPPEPRGRRVPAHVRAAIRRGLAAEPAERHPSMAALIAALAGRRRRWPYVAAAATTLAAAGVAVVALRGDPVAEAIARCDDLAAPGGWTLAAAPKPALARALATTFEGHATAWRDLARSSCVAAARGELSAPAHAAIRRCLDRRAESLAWIASRERVPPLELLGLAESIEPVESCATPGEPATAPERLALERDLDRVTPFVHFTPGTAVGLADVLATAKRLGDPAPLAEAQYLVALELDEHGRARVAEAELRRAIASAEHARDDRIRTRASALLAVLAARGGRLVDATGFRDLAASAAARAPDLRTKLAVERAERALAYARRDAPAELAALRRIEGLLVARFGEHSYALSSVRFELAAVLHRMGSPEAAAALAAATTGLAQLTDASSQLAIEQTLLALRAPAERILLQEQLIALARRESPERVPRLLGSLGYDYELVGDYDRAFEVSREALALAPDDPELVVELTENAANHAFELASRTDDRALRARRIAEALALIEQLPAPVRDGDGVQALRGRVLLLAERYLEAIPHLTAALAAAERAEEPKPHRIALRGFALAQALWAVGGARDRDRARALAAQAATRIAEALAEFARDRDAYGNRYDELEAEAARIDAWRRTHR